MVGKEGGQAGKEGSLKSYEKLTERLLYLLLKRARGGVVLASQPLIRRWIDHNSVLVNLQGRKRRTSGQEIAYPSPLKYGAYPGAKIQKRENGSSWITRSEKNFTCSLTCSPVHIISTILLEQRSNDIW